MGRDQADLAFLPINGANMCYPGMLASGMPASMTPEQAAAAATLLQAKLVCPFHYGLYHHPTQYVDRPDAERGFVIAAMTRNLSVQLVPHGEAVRWD